MASLNDLMISVSGVRGIVGAGMTPEAALKIAEAYGSEFGPGPIVVGRDSRTSGDMIKHAVWAGLLSVGCDVVDIDVASTPTTQMATEKQKAKGGIIITASHNPREWNALKLLSPQGLFLDPETGSKIMARVEKEEFRFAPWNRIGKVIAHPTALEEHIAAIKNLSVLNVNAIRQRKFKIVVDCCHGAGGAILSQLFDWLGCSVIFHDFEPTGLFTRNPEPVPENLGELCAKVKTHQADLGIAVDPDVDRLAFVSEEGQPLGEESTLVLAARFVLSREPGEVVTNASTTQALDDVAAQFDSSVQRTPVGEIHVAMKAAEIKAVLAGEGNGGVMYPPLHLGRDAMVGIALVLQLLAESGGTLSALRASLPQYEMVKEKISLPFSVNAQALVQTLLTLEPAGSVDKLDGLKYHYDKSWVHVRASNTEPIIRIIAEAKSREEAQRLVQKFKKDIQRLN